MNNCYPPLQGIPTAIATSNTLSALTVEGFFLVMQRNDFLKVARCKFTLSKLVTTMAIKVQN